MLNKNKRQKSKILAFSPKLSQKRGLSAVVETVIMIALALAVVSIIWVVVNNLVTGKLGEAESCFGVFDKISINPEYTCYNSTENELQFSITLGELNVEDILVSIYGNGATTSFKINEDAPSELRYLNGTSPAGIPDENQGRTYVYSLSPSFTKAPDSLEIAPIINGKLCEGPGPLQQFDSCASLA
jgi:hypothetical protein